MKRILLRAALFLFLLGFTTYTQAQSKSKSKTPVECENMPVFTYSPIDNTVMYSKVIEAQGKTQAELYDITMSWYIQMFTNAEKGIVYQDTQSKSKLICKGGMKSDLTDAIVNYTLEFTFKDGKMKAEFKSINLEFPQANVTRSFEWYIESTSESGVKQMKGLRCDVVKETDTRLKGFLLLLEKQVQLSTDNNF